MTARDAATMKADAMAVAAALAAGAGVLRAAVLADDEMEALAASIDPVCAHQVLFMCVGEGEGYAPGDFRRTLYDLLAKADPSNFIRVMEVFPAEATAFSVAVHLRGGLDVLRKAARRA